MIEQNRFELPSRQGERGKSMITAFIEKKFFPGFEYVEPVLMRTPCVMMEYVLLRSLICSYIEVHHSEGVLQTFSVIDGSIETIHCGDKSEVAQL